MKKLKLDLDTLAVESYATQAAEVVEGTVVGHVTPVDTTSVVVATVNKTIEWTIAATEYYSLFC